MPRKLRRKIKRLNRRVEPESQPEQEKTVRPKKIKKYRKQRCKYVDEQGNQCKYNAVGKSTLCKKHGGDPVIKENLIPAKSEPALVGLVTKYDPVTHPVLFMDYSRMGMSDVEIAAEFKVSVETLRNWAEKYEMFNRAFEIGKAMHEAWWLEKGKSGLNNRGFNTALFKFLTSNKLGYSDKMETKSLNMNVHGVLKVPDAVSEEEWEKDDEDIVDVTP